MTVSKTLAIVFVVLGELLLLGGLILCYMAWPNIFEDASTGPVLLVVGVAIEILGLRKLARTGVNNRPIN